MADIINLRQARKARARTDAEAKAAANRVRFGRTAQEKQASEAEARRTDKLLDGARREGDDRPIPGAAKFLNGLANFSRERRND